MTYLYELPIPGVKHRQIIRNDEKKPIYKALISYTGRSNLLYSVHYGLVMELHIQTIEMNCWKSNFYVWSWKSQ